MGFVTALRIEAEQFAQEATLNARGTDGNQSRCLLLAGNILPSGEKAAWDEIRESKSISWAMSHDQHVLGRIYTS